jgi:hypothetical protein
LTATLKYAIFYADLGNILALREKLIMSSFEILGQAFRFKMVLALGVAGGIVFSFVVVFCQQ